MQEIENRQIPIFGVESALPRECGGLFFDYVDYYDDEKFGVGVRYEGPSIIHADAYLFNYGIDDIKDDLNSPYVMGLFQGACNDIFKMEDMGIYVDPVMILSDYLHLPEDSSEPFCLLASFCFSENPGPGVVFTGKRISHLALRVDRGFINKVRFSHPIDEESAELGFKMFINFLIEWTTAIQKFGCLE